MPPRECLETSQIKTDTALQLGCVLTTFIVQSSTLSQLSGLLSGRADDEPAKSQGFATASRPGHWQKTQSLVRDSRHRFISCCMVYKTISLLWGGPSCFTARYLPFAALSMRLEKLWCPHRVLQPQPCLGHCVPNARVLAPKGQVLAVVHHGPKGKEETSFTFTNSDA